MSASTVRRRTRIDGIIDASIDYPADPASVERAKVYLREHGAGEASLVEFLQAMPNSTERERSVAALAFLGVLMRGEW